MARGNAPIHAFNRGKISRLALARTDRDRVRLSAEKQRNWMPRGLGSMMLRPGLKYIGQTASNNPARLVAFDFGTTTPTMGEITSVVTRVWNDDVLVTRAGSTAAVTGGTFTSTSLTGWTDADESGATSEWFTGNYMSLVGTRFARAIRRQAVTSSAGTHGLSVSIERGRVFFKVGSSSGGDDYIAEKTLRPGQYSFAVASTGNFTIEFAANTYYRSLVDSVAVESSGAMAIASTWAGADLQQLRWDQSNDVMFVAASSYAPHRIERYSSDSWGVAKYEPEDGPFRVPNVTAKRLTPSGLSGNITLECDQPFFQSGHAGALFRLTSAGQEASVTPSGTEQWSTSIRVSGVDDARQFDIFVDSTGYDATVRVQRSIGQEGSWANVTGLVYTSSVVSTGFDDELDNQIIFYRIGVGATYSSGAPVATLRYAAGGKTGIVRVNAVTAATESSASVLSNLGSTQATELWEEGEWSTYRGWPSAVVLHEGRNWWGGLGKVWGSIAGNYDSFDPAVEGDAGAISKTLDGGAAEKVEWMVSLGRLIVGTGSREMQAKTGSLEEPLTPDNFAFRDISTQGSAPVQAVKIDRRAMFVQRGETRVMEISYSGESLDYETIDQTVLVPEQGEPRIVRMAVQRQPDTRLHCIRGSTGGSTDGTAAVLVSDKAENVSAWIDVETSGKTNGFITEVATFPGTVEDNVYYVVKREINGSTVRYIEKWEHESNARGGVNNHIADSFATQNSSATTTVSGADHLVGSSVIAWGNGVDLGSYTVSSTGTFTLTTASSTVTYGLPYDALYVSSKLAYAERAGTALTQKKKIDHLGVILADAHAQGLQYGPSSDYLKNLPLIENGAAVSTDTVHTSYDEQALEIGGLWDNDTRLVLRAVAPRPVTVLGAIITIDTKDNV